MEKRYSWENAVFVTDTWKASDKINVTYGLRASSFSILGKGDFFTIDPAGNIIGTTNYKQGEFVKTYFNLELGLPPAISLTLPVR